MLGSAPPKGTAQTARRRASGGVATMRLQAQQQALCHSSDHTAGSGGQTFSRGSSCLHPAPWQATATQTCRPFPGCQADLEKSLPGVGGLQPEPWACLLQEKPSAHPHLQGQPSVPAASVFPQAFIEPLLCARHCASLCLHTGGPTLSLPENVRTQSCTTDEADQPLRGDMCSLPPSCGRPASRVPLKPPEVTLYPVTS